MNANTETDDGFWMWLFINFVVNPCKSLVKRETWKAAYKWCANPLVELTIWCWLVPTSLWFSTWFIIRQLHTYPYSLLFFSFLFLLGLVIVAHAFYRGETYMDS